jgi:hypothetical protein
MGSAFLFRMVRGVNGWCLIYKEVENEFMVVYERANG